jgi:copper chaperone
MFNLHLMARSSPAPIVAAANIDSGQCGKVEPVLRHEVVSMQTFNVTGMTCAHCERAVIGAIQARDGDAKVRVDLQAGVVQIEGRLSEAVIREAIEAEGYQVQ